MTVLILQYKTGTADLPWSSVYTLIHGESDFTDQTGKVWVPHGSIAAGVLGGKFGNCISIPNTAVNHYISWDGEDLAVWNNIFTIEGWFKPTTSNTGDTRTWLEHDLNTSQGVACFVGNSGIGIRSNGLNNLLVTTSISTSAWTHIAWISTGTGRQIFINGTLSGSDAVVPTVSGFGLSIGPATANTPYRYVGLMDDIRITTDVRYTSNFTPPTEPFPNS